ncbi:hypothetical protein BDY19DRAFT_977529, partial [Irpex rosettiformis]
LPDVSLCCLTALVIAIAGTCDVYYLFYTASSCFSCNRFINETPEPLVSVFTASLRTQYRPVCQTIYITINPWFYLYRTPA